MEPVSGSTTLYGHQVSTFQSNMSVSGTDISGTLAYVEGGLDSPLSGDGHFLALEFDSDDWSDYESIKVGLRPSQGTGLVEVKGDPDKNGVFKITSTDQKFVVQTSNEGYHKETVYDLSELVLETE